MPIRDRRFALPVAIGNYLDFDLVSREAGRHDDVFHTALPSVVCCEQPKLLSAIGACDGEDDTLALFRPPPGG